MRYYCAKKSPYYLGNFSEITKNEFEYLKGLSKPDFSLDEYFSTPLDKVKRKSILEKITYSFNDKDAHILSSTRNIKKRYHKDVISAIKKLSWFKMKHHPYFL